jgi:phosphatidylserine/phosphatidylglycerophosphate/cardiolipin synthase-like enzyme
MPPGGASPALALDAADGPVQASVSVCFVPGERCFDQIVDAISQARTGIRVQAYGFTSGRVLGALVAAKTRGLVVEAVLDKSSLRQSSDPAGNGPARLFQAGIPVWIDYRPAIAHSKIIIIDQHLVIGGSANYTKAAETRNAENVLFIDSADIAGRFLDNWEARRDASLRYDGAE